MSILFIKKKYRNILRYNIKRKRQLENKNSSYTIFASNCVGGVIYNDLGTQFMSPTINMYIKPCDFVKFLKNPQKYFDTEMKQLKSDFKYPVVQIKDIVLYCVHYKSLQEVEEKWNSRAKRIQWDNIYVIMSERDGCTYQDLVDFDKLPYNKVVFVHKQMDEIESSIYIEGLSLDGSDGHYVKSLTEFDGNFTGRRLLDKWSYV